MSDILYKAAATVNKLSNYSYELHLANRKRTVIISLISNNPKDFVHISGLSHLADSPIISGNNTSERIRIFKNILNKHITFADIQSSQFLYSPMSPSINPYTGKEYTIYDRIEMMSRFENILDNAYTGQFYKWDRSRTSVLKNKHQYRNVSINCDYALSIPDLISKSRAYVFMYQTNKTSSKDEPIKLNICSSFLDSSDLTSGQISPYTILQETKINSHTGESIVLYKHKTYNISDPISPHP